MSTPINNPFMDFPIICPETKEDEKLILNWFQAVLTHYHTSLIRRKKAAEWAARTRTSKAMFDLEDASDIGEHSDEGEEDRRFCSHQVQEAQCRDDDHSVDTVGTGSEGGSSSAGVNGTETDDLDLVDVRVISLEIERADLGREEKQSDSESSVSDPVDDRLRIQVVYEVCDDKTYRETFIARITRTFGPNIVSEETQGLLNVVQREVDLVSKLIPAVEDWSLSRGLDLTLAVPKCIYGEYITDQDATANYGCDLDPATNRTLALALTEDLVEEGFQPISPHKKNLSIPEIGAVIRELALIHVTTWGCQVEEEQTLVQKWPFLLSSKDLAPISHYLVMECLKTFSTILQNRLRDEPDGKLLFEQFSGLEPKLLQLFNELLNPKSNQFPVSLIHFDLQPGNIQLHYKDGYAETQGLLLGSENIECRFEGWKIASVGSPTHDLAFLFLSSLDPKTRRENMKELLKFYYSIFMVSAHTLEVELPISFSLAELESQFKDSFLLAILLGIGNMDEEPQLDSDAMNSFVAALRDLVEWGVISSNLQKLNMKAHGSSA